MRGRLFSHGDLLLLICSVLWGASFALTRGAVSHLPVMVVVGVRFLVAALLLFGVSPKSRWPFSRTEFVFGGAIGVAMFASYGSQAASLAYLEPGQTAFIEALYVPLVPLVQFALFPRTSKIPGPRMLSGVVLAFVGLLLISGTTPHGLHYGLGIWFAIIAALSSTVEIILVSRFAVDIDPTKLGFIQCLTVGILSSGGLARPGHLPILLPEGIAMIALLGVFSAFLQPAMNYAMKTVSATRSTILFASEPIWAAVSGYFMGEVFTAPQAVGATLIILSVLLSGRE